MNYAIKEFIQKELQKGLLQCSNGQRQSFVLIFMNRQYTNVLPEKVTATISDDLIEHIVMNVEEHKLQDALTMVQSTVKSNAMNRKEN